MAAVAGLNDQAVLEKIRNGEPVTTAERYSLMSRGAATLPDPAEGGYSVSNSSGGVTTSGLGISAANEIAGTVTGTAVGAVSGATGITGAGSVLGLVSDAAKNKSPEETAVNLGTNVAKEFVAAATPFGSLINAGIDVGKGLATGSDKVGQTASQGLGSAALGMLGFAAGGPIGGVAGSLVGASLGLSAYDAMTESLGLGKDEAADVSAASIQSGQADIAGLAKAEALSRQKEEEAYGQWSVSGGFSHGMLGDKDIDSSDRHDDSTPEGLMGQYSSLGELASSMFGGAEEGSGGSGGEGSGTGSNDTAGAAGTDDGIGGERI